MPVADGPFEVCRPAGEPRVAVDASKMGALPWRRTGRCCRSWTRWTRPPPGRSVPLLLESAAAAVHAAGWTPVNGDIALEVTIKTPGGRPPGDATNFLGGIGDVL